MENLQWTMKTYIGRCLWTLNNGKYTLNNLKQKFYYGKLTLDNGKPSLNNEEKHWPRTIENGIWKMENQH